MSLTLLIAAATVAHFEAPYKVIKTVKVGGDGGFDYVYADSDNRRLYIARGGSNARVTVFDLDTFESKGEIAKTNARGAAVDAKFGHGFASSKPVAMWDAKTLKPIKTIPVEGRPDGILADPFTHHVYVFSHSEPNVTVLDAKDGSVVGTVNLDGAPEQAALDGKGKLFVDLEDKDAVAVVDTKTLKKVATWSLDGKGGGNAGLAMDPKNHVLFVTGREPATMVMMDANTGKVLGAVPIGSGTDGAGFSAKTGEAFSSNGDGTLTIVKQSAPGKFEVAQTLKTMRGAKTMTIDAKTGHVLLIAAEYGPAPTGGRGRGTMVPGSFSIVVVGR